MLSTMKRQVAILNPRKAGLFGLRPHPSVDGTDKREPISKRLGFHSNSKLGAQTLFVTQFVLDGCFAPPPTNPRSLRSLPHTIKTLGKVRGYISKKVIDMCHSLRSAEAFASFVR